MPQNYVKYAKVQMPWLSLTTPSEGVGKWVECRLLPKEFIIAINYWGKWWAEYCIPFERIYFGVHKEEKCPCKSDCCKTCCTSALFCGRSNVQQVLQVVDFHLFEKLSAPRSKFVESRVQYSVHHLPKIKRFSLCSSSLIVIHWLNCNNIQKVQNMVISCGKGYFSG